MLKGTGKDKQTQRSIQRKITNMNADNFMDLLTDVKLHEIIERNTTDQRIREYPTCLTLSLFMRQVLSADSSCQKVVNDHNISLVQQGNEPNSSHTGAYCSARSRLNTEMLIELVHATGTMLSEELPASWLWHGRRVKLVDGTTITLPDTPNNQSKYPQHDQQLDGVGFPIIRVVAVTCFSSGAVLGLNMGPYKGKGTGEMSLFTKLINKFEPGDIMLADRYFASFFLVSEMKQQGVDVLFEQHGARITDFRYGQKLGTRDHIVKWTKPARPTYMSKEQYELYPKEIEIREVKVGGKVLVTTLTCSKTFKKSSLKSLYQGRWNVELDIRDIKTTLGMESLSCKTVKMCEKELWVYMLAYNIIRILMADAAQAASIEPRKISFKHALQIWNAMVGQPGLHFNKKIRELTLRLVSQKRVGKRPGRIEPRAVKKRPKPFPRLQTNRQKARDAIRRNTGKQRAVA